MNFADSTPKTVLLLEDDAILREVIRETLKRGGFQVIEAENGLAALEAVTESLDGVDLIVTDVMMPKMSGPEFIHRVAPAVASKNLQVLFLSGYSDRHLQSSAVRDNLSQVQKPISTKKLVEKARELVARKTAVPA